MCDEPGSEYEKVTPYVEGCFGFDVTGDKSSGTCPPLVLKVVDVTFLCSWFYPERLCT
jgi:hypothetical protein